MARICPGGGPGAPGGLGRGARRDVPGGARLRRRERRRAAAVGRLAGRDADRPRRHRTAGAAWSSGWSAARGGAGATTFACALGQVAARSGDAVVVDADPLGPGVDRVLGLETRDGIRWDALCQTTGRLSARSLREALPRGRAAGRADLARRRARQPAGVRRARGAVGGPARPRLGRGRPAAQRRSAGRGGRGAVRPAARRGGAHRGRGRLGGAAVRAAARPDPGLRLVVRGSGLDADGRSARATGVAACSPRWPTSAAWPSPSTSGSGRCARGAGRWAGRAARSSTHAPRSRRPRHDPSPASARGAGRGGPRPAGPRARRADPAPGGRGAARDGRPVGDATVLAVYEALRRDVVGAGPLEPLLRTPGVTDVLVNGADRVYLDRGDGLEPTEVRFPDEEAVRRLAQRLAGARRAAARRRHAVRRPPAGRRHPVPRRAGAGGAARARVISLRVPRRPRLHPRRAGRGGHAHRRRWPAAATRIVGARLAFLVSGGTGSGKTTLLAALLVRVAPERADRAGRGRLRAAARPPARRRLWRAGRPTSRAPARSTLRTLVRQALRMRPDRLVVGEVRGAEVVDLLAALNTGHEGGCGTLHANSAARRAGPGRGARAGRRARPRGGAQPARLRPSTWCCTWPAGPTACAGSRQVAVPERGARRAWCDGVARRRSTPTARTPRAGGRGPGRGARRPGHRRDRASRPAVPALAVLLLVPAPPRLPTRSLAAPPRWLVAAGWSGAVAAVAWRAARPAGCSWSLGRGDRLGGGCALVRQRRRRREAEAGRGPGAGDVRAAGRRARRRPAARAGAGPGRRGLAAARRRWPRRSGSAPTCPLRCGTAAALGRGGRPAGGGGRLAGRPPHRPGAGRRGRPGRARPPRRRRPPGGWSTASWPRPAPPRGWSRACRCWRC